MLNCLVSRAVYLDLAERYDTKSLLMVLWRFVSVHVAANKELRAMVKNWNKAHILDFSPIEGMWHFDKSTEAPWENGCSESLIILVKRAIVSTVGNRILSYGELQTALFEIANWQQARF